MKCCVEEVELNNVRAKTLTKEAEVMVTATHAIYKEHIVLLIDCLTLWSWISRDVWDLANEFRSTKALEVVTNICKSIKNGFIEAPYKLKHHEIIKAYLEKILKDPVFRETSFNMLKYITKHRGIGVKILGRLTRISY